MDRALRSRAFGDAPEVRKATETWLLEAMHLFLVSFLLLLVRRLLLEAMHLLLLVKRTHCVFFCITFFTATCLGVVFDTVSHRRVSVHYCLLANPEAFDGWIRGG